MSAGRESLARVIGHRRVAMVDLGEVQTWIRWTRAGVTALGGKKEYPVFIDESALQYPVVRIGGPERRADLLAPHV